MPHLYATPPDKLVDPQGRPYFLWDVDLTVDAFRERVVDPRADVRAMWMGKLMRQAKPDDVFQFVTLQDIQQDWPLISRHLGRSLPFWRWILTQWGTLDDE